MNKSFRTQATGRITLSLDSYSPLSPLDDMKYQVSLPASRAIQIGASATLRGGEAPHLFLSQGAGLSPAEGGVEPTAGFTFNNVISPSPLTRASTRAHFPAASPRPRSDRYRRNNRFRFCLGCVRAV